MKLVSLAQLGRVEKEYEINKDLKIKLHTLNVKEQQAALLSLPEDANLTEAAKFTLMQISMLVQATDEVNGEKASKEELTEFFSTVQYSLLLEIFAKYLDLSGEQGQILEELKKK